MTAPDGKAPLSPSLTDAYHQCPRNQSAELWRGVKNLVRCPRNSLAQPVDAASCAAAP